ncbi:methyltransferase domain-containing protein [Mycolicibacterium goodii]|uniref:methyltransferase domain-containing protein n=1 Tax=Mycolicibacterium goodii TaxID=134601 RepID=UPI00256F0C18|nr:methyltransferase domain-containing protein [Mycolicibacterium goodii]
MAKAARVVDTSFFTPAALVGHIWGVLRAAGFTGGSVLDLGCGSGRFLTHAPADLPVVLTGVEADPISAQIARTLHPGANIITGDLQAVSLPHKRFDAAVGNVPFSAARVHDGATGFYGPLHEYFVARAVSAVRPGGYVVVVTSRHELDAVHGLSPVIGRHADLVAAVRLPSGYFRESGTDVVADVLVLRVRDGDDDVHGWHPADREERTLLTGEVGQRYVREWVSAWWELHPELVAGTMRLTGFDREPVAVDTDNAAAAVASAFAAVEPLLVPYTDGDAVVADLADVRLTDDQGRKEGSLHIVDGQVVRVVDGELEVVARPSAELRALIGLRDAAVALVDAESDWDRPDESVQPLRIACRDAYEAYVARYGALNRGTVTEGRPDPDTGMPRLGWRTPALGGFRQDPDAPVVFALELFDQDSGEASPAPILVRRVNKWPEPATSASTAGEALAICLGEGRGLDLDRIGGLLGLTDHEEVFDELGVLVYRDPRDGRALIARDYLCGDVRAKLRDALAAAAIDPRYERNVAALEAVQPPWLGREDIRIELGSPWVTAGDIVDFCGEVFGARARVEHLAPLAAWEITGRGQLSPEARIAYCSPRLDAFELLQIGLNGAAPVVWDEIYDEQSHTKRKVRNADATEAAEQKLADIQGRFSLWVWENADRERRIVEEYNHTMNAHVLRNHDGSHLTFPGLAEGIDLWPWQRDFVDRAVSTPAVFNAHEVGLGKTLCAIALAMTLRQFGLANRVGYIVPLHLIEQATRQCYQAWPSGRFLIVTREDLHGDARRRFVARCATGDWDLVIMTHETFTSLPVPATVERAWLEDQLGELENFARTEGYTGKRIASAVRSLEGRLKRLRSSTNDPKAITFRSLGLDYLIVDEADKFRRMPIVTRAEGFSLGSSQRALDLYLKLSLLRRANPDRPHACLMTGTPFTNTLAEAFVWQTMLAPEQLARTGLGHFDAWAAQFVRYKVLIETSPDGSGFLSRRRPGTIQNVPNFSGKWVCAGVSRRTAEKSGLPCGGVRRSRASKAMDGACNLR